MHTGMDVTQRRIGSVTSKISLVLWCVFLAASLAAQTTVTTTGGTANTVPLFTGTSTIGNSAITQANSNVGIGTTTPGEKIDVLGNMVWGAGSERTSSGSASFAFNRKVDDGSIYSPSAFAYQFQHTGSTSAASDYLAWQVYAPSGAGVTANALVVNGNGNVGIGTSSPGTRLQVVGNTAIGQNTNGTAIIDAYNGDAFFGDNSATNGIAVNPSGFVGIGTATPGARLEVNGGLTLSAGSGGSITFADGTRQTTAAINTGGTITGVTAGTGLTGGGTSGNVTLSVNGNVVRNNVTNTFTAQQNFSSAPISVTNSSVLVNNANANQYGVNSTVLSGIALGVWNKQFNNTTWSSGSVIAGWAGSNQTQIFHVDTSGTTYTYNAFVAGGLDYAEHVNINPANARYEPGDVLVIDTTGTSRFTLSSEPRSKLVAGVYSTKPGVLGSSHPMDAKARDNEVPLALVGRVPCKVSTENGPISVGDLLVTSSTPGYAMRADDDAKPGTIVGKALQPLSASIGIGKIEVLVILQ